MQNSKTPVKKPVLLRTHPEGSLLWSLPFEHPLKKTSALGLPLLCRRCRLGRDDLSEHRVSLTSLENRLDWFAVAVFIYFPRRLLFEQSGPGTNGVVMLLR